MSDTLESLQRRRNTAGKLRSVVRTMKAIAASNIGQYEMAVKSLQDYYRTVSLSLYACLMDKQNTATEMRSPKNIKSSRCIYILFGSDQGLVGKFNEGLVTYLLQRDIPNKQEVWTIGDRLSIPLASTSLSITNYFSIPHSVQGITSLIDTVCETLETYIHQKKADIFYLFYNTPLTNESYHPVSQQLFPLDDNWKKELSFTSLPTHKIPQIISNTSTILPSLLKEYTFILLYKACAESLSSENMSRLHAMQRAEKSIDENLEAINQQYNQLRQSTIDEELFDVIAGAKVLVKEKTKSLRVN